MIRLFNARFSRRQALAGLAGATGATLAAPSLAQAQAAPRPTLISNSVCMVTPQAVEGPYYFDAGLERQDIREDRIGVPLRTVFQVVRGADCTPLPGVRVDIWHADATGHYSGYGGQGDDRSDSTEGETFLRGTQFADDAGLVTFQTLYPGWYRGRTTHIHFKVFVDDRNVLMGQTYFPDALSEFLYGNVPPYNDRTGLRDTLNADDHVLSASGGGYETFFSIKEEADSYVASLVIAADPNGADVAGNAAGAGPGGPPPNGGPEGPGGPGTSAVALTGAERIARLVPGQN